MQPNLREALTFLPGDVVKIKGEPDISATVITSVLVLGKRLDRNEGGQIEPRVEYGIRIGTYMYYFDIEALERA